MPNLTSEIGDIFDREETRTYPVKEGDLTVETGIDVVNGMPRVYASFEDEVTQNNFLELVDAGGELVAVQLASAGGLATHFNQYIPELDQSLPIKDTSDGDYPRRFVGASQLGYKPEIALPLADDNSKITAGDKLEVKDPKEGLDKTSATTNVCIAMEPKLANSGGVILVELRGPIKVKTKT
jgi:hypothetical protein